MLGTLQEVGTSKPVEVLSTLPDWATFYQNYMRANRHSFIKWNFMFASVCLAAAGLSPTVRWGVQILRLATGRQERCGTWEHAGAPVLHDFLGVCSWARQRLGFHGPR